MARWLQEMRWPDVEEYLRGDDRILIPLGSTEQHGRHAPLGTDSLLAIALAEDASERTGVVIAPPLWYGWSPHHMAAPGTITVRPEVLMELLYDVISSLSRHGFRKFVLINGHRLANLPWIQIAAERAQRELRVIVLVFDPLYMSLDLRRSVDLGPFGHGDEMETSHLLHKFPRLVRMEEAKDHVPEEIIYADPLNPRDSLCYVPSTEERMRALRELTGDAVIGTPTRADPEKGRIYHEHLVGRLVQVLQSLKERGE
ncbi:MAG: creatininase family protein [Candidatus Korarchaeota archaeon NZ13-K]|nr:MAG: creatininase family protein [Candidatus Korarchaeota archaeon NZ13-K]